MRRAPGAEHSLGKHGNPASKFEGGDFHEALQIPVPPELFLASGLGYFWSPAVSTPRAGGVFRGRYDY
jgi:hypothetical protein